MASVVDSNHVLHLISVSERELNPPDLLRLRGIRASVVHERIVHIAKQNVALQFGDKLCHPRPLLID